MKLILVLLATVYFKASFQEGKSREQLEDSNKGVNSRNQVLFEGLSYLAFLKFDKGHYCAGTLISHRFVLTAAHCVQDHISGVVHLGWNNQTFELEVPIKHMKTYHKGGKPNGYDEFGRYKNYDIALIELAEYVNFTRRINRAVLPSTFDYITTQSRGTLAGWYSNHKLKTIQAILRVNHVAEDIKCLPAKCDKSRWFKWFYNWIDWLKVYMRTLDYDQDSTFCSLSNGEGIDCAGIGGGPLVIDGKVHGISMAITKWEDIGDSQINGTCTGGDYNTFTKVTSFLWWIEKYTDIQIDI